jgi:cation:H+ antiporter
LGILVALIVVFISSVIITRASDAFETASDYLGRNLTDGVKGATINAIGSSMPELFTTLIFLVVLNDADGFAGGIGTTAGSAIFNGMIIPALVGIVVITSRIAKNIHLSRKVILRDGLTLIAAEIALIFLLNSTELSAWHGVVLMTMYALYVVLLLGSMSKRSVSDSSAALDNTPSDNHEELEESTENKRSLLKSVFLFAWVDLEAWFVGNKDLNKKRAWLLLISSTLLTGLSCHWLVESCIWLGSDTYEFAGFSLQGLGLPIYFLSVIIASAATSLPDTILSLKDAKKGNYNDAISNALGSNIFDICFALGLPLFLYSIVNGPITLSAEVAQNVSELRIFLVLLTIGSFFIFYFGRKFGLIKCILLLALYIIFVLFIVGDTLNWTMVDGLKDLLLSINSWIKRF